MNMSNCPECFTKQSLPTGVIIGITICCFVIAICFGVLIGIIASNEGTPQVDSSKPTVESKEEIKYIEISASDLYAAFEENEIAADEKFKGKLIKITGIVNDINSKDTFSSANILLDVDDSTIFGCVQCNFNSTNEKALVSVEKGQSVTITGTCGGLSLYNIIVNACELQQD